VTAKLVTGCTGVPYAPSDRSTSFRFGRRSAKPRPSLNFGPIRASRELTMHNNNFGESLFRETEENGGVFVEFQTS
jgi:hypothetical protein